MARMKLEIEGLSELLTRIEALNGDSKEIAEEALRKTHAIVTAKAEKGMQAAYLPAKGKYATGDTLKHLRRNAEVEWKGTVGEVKVGFDINSGGLVSIFLMYGTPRMKKDQELYNAFKGKKTLTEVKEAQEQVFWDAIRRLEG